jgi:hypothetical protein
VELVIAGGYVSSKGHYAYTAGGSLRTP